MHVWSISNVDARVQPLEHLSITLQRAVTALRLEKCSSLSQCLNDRQTCFPFPRFRHWQPEDARMQGNSGQDTQDTAIIGALLYSFRKVVREPTLCALILRLGGLDMSSNLPDRHDMWVHDCVSGRQTLILGPLQRCFFAQTVAILLCSSISCFERPCYRSFAFLRAMLHVALYRMTSRQAEAAVRRFGRSSSLRISTREEVLALGLLILLLLLLVDKPSYSVVFRGANRHDFWCLFAQPAEADLACVGYRKVLIRMMQFG